MSISKPGSESVWIVAKSLLTKNISTKTCSIELPSGVRLSRLEEAASMPLCIVRECSGLRSVKNWGLMRIDVLKSFVLPVSIAFVAGIGTNLDAGMR